MISSPAAMFASSSSRVWAASVFLLCLAWVCPAHAQVALSLTEIDAGGVRVDGALREWRSARFVEVGEGRDASMRVALAYDANGLYLGAEVRDDRMVRSASPGRDEDAVVLTLALPARRGLSGLEIFFWAGEAGRSAASVGIGPIARGRLSSPPGASIVEAPSSGGYTLEAFVPWRAIEGGSRWQEGRGSIRLRDVDSAAHPEIESEPSLAPVDPAHLDRLPSLAPSGGESAQLAQFLSSRGLTGARPAHDLRGDIAGDGRPERVVLVDRFVVVLGAGWGDGRSYAFHELPIEAAADLREARLQDLTGDGQRELVVVLRQRGGGGSRDLWQVIGFAGDRIAPVFGIEVRKEASGGYVESEVRVTRSRRRGEAPTLEARAGRAHDLDAARLREAPPRDVEAILLPWGPVRARRYRWDGHTFARVGEDPNPDYVDPAAASASSSSTSTGSSSTSSTGAASSAPAAPGMEAVLAEFRRQRSISPRARPSFSFSADVAGSASTETVQVFGRDLVVVGPEFRNGTGWFHYQLPGQRAEDVLDVRAVELTGDARAELVARVRQQVGDVQREILLVYQFTPVGFPTLLTREVARAQAGNRIENEVRFERGGLEIRPGRATGWSASSWPFSDGTSDGIGAVLLPWRDSALRFRYARGALVPAS